eukprot:XP_014043628.1 PREDICTED: pituitary tumor-transforming gene 1 protein-interacting protein-like [Salmo salar]
MLLFVRILTFDLFSVPVNFEALIIAMAVLGGTIIISIAVCCCCCCCCKKRQSGPDRDEERFARRREEIRQRADERKVERKVRHDDIRKKYGTYLPLYLYRS